MFTLSEEFHVYALEAVVRRCSLKKMFLKISQNSQENTCARVSFFNKVTGPRSASCNLDILQHSVTFY